MSKLRKNERNYLFNFKSLFSLYQSEKINLLKAIDAAKFEVKKVKLYILQIIFKEISAVAYTKKNTTPFCLF